MVKSRVSSIFQLLTFLHILCQGYCYICSTPKEWLELGDISAHYGVKGSTLSSSRGRKWPNGVIKYHLNSSLSDQDKAEVSKAIDEYHKKTCIRFEPKTNGDLNYVSIEVDESICGMAHVCMQGGYQFVKLGKNCRNKNNIIHQLGHTICLSHEQDRHEGDRFIAFNESCSSGSTSFQRSYDQASQMHIGCDSRNQCGYQVTSGLSILDADYINAMYNCQGCYRHRWIPKSLLVLNANSQNMYSFGYYDLEKQPMYPCRAYFKGEVSIGKYNSDEGTCYLGFGDKEYKLCDGFEVFTIPGGVRNKVTEYLLSPAHDGMSPMEQRNLFKDAVVAGRLPWADGGDYGHGYIAFGTIPNFQKSCKYNTAWWSGGKNRKIDVIGRVWRYHNRTEAFAALCELEFRLSIYYVLTCKNQTNGTLEMGYLDTSSATQNDSQETIRFSIPLSLDENEVTQNGFVMAYQQNKNESQGNNFFYGFLTCVVIFIILGAILGGLVYFKVIKMPPFLNNVVRYRRDYLFTEQI